MLKGICWQEVSVYLPILCEFETKFQLETNELPKRKLYWAVNTATILRSIHGKCIYTWDFTILPFHQSFFFPRDILLIFQPQKVKVLEICDKF